MELENKNLGPYVKEVHTCSLSKSRMSSTLACKIFSVCWRYKFSWKGYCTNCLNLQGNLLGLWNTGQKDLPKYL